MEGGVYPGGVEVRENTMSKYIVFIHEIKK